jgi:hypothetical protein
MHFPSDSRSIADAPPRYYTSLKDFIFLIAIACLVGVAAWLAPASVYPVSWTSGGTARAALLPAWSVLAWFIAASLVAVAALTAFWVSRGWSLPTLRRTLAPLALLGLWVLPYAPWLADQCPLLLVLAGPLKFIILAGALVGCVANLASSRALRVPRLSIRTLVVSLSLVVFVGGAIYRAWTLELGGDEPHYLMITQSLLVDGDLKVDNNYRQREYLAFTQLELEPHYLRRGVDHRIYSIHAPGLPALLLPAYALAGYRGAIAFVGLLAALAAIAIFMAGSVVGGEGVAFLSWAAMCLTVPFLPMSSTIYSEVPATLVMACVVLWLVRSDPASARSWVWRGLLLAALPWFHTKYASLLVGVVPVLLFRLRRNPRHALAMIAPLAVSIAGWLTFFYVIYGTPDPTAPYGGGGGGLDWRNVPRGVLGLFFDRAYGLAVYSPIFACALAGWWAMVRQREHRWLAIVLSFITALFLAGTLRVYMWWGGWCPPARFFLPLVPVVAPMVAVAFARWRAVVSRSFIASALLWSLIVSGLLVARPIELQYDQMGGVGSLVSRLGAGLPMLPAIMPSFVQEDWIGQLPLVGIWLASALTAILVVHALVASVRRRASLFGVAATGCVVFGLVVAVLARPFMSAGVRADATQAARFSLLDAYDAVRFRTVRVNTGQRVGIGGLADIATISLPVKPTSWSDTGLGPYELPPGRYDLRLTFARSESPAGDLIVGFNDASKGYVFYREGPMSSPTRATIAVPAAMPALWVRTSSKDMQDALRLLEFVPRQIVSRSARDELGRVRSVASVTGGADGVYVFYVDDDTFPEGGRYWTRGGRPGRVQIAPGGAHTLTLTLHVGAPDGEVRVTVGGEVQRLTLSPTEDFRTLTFPIAPGTQLLPIEVYTAGGVTPHEIDVSSHDTRFLGCYVILSAS